MYFPSGVSWYRPAGIYSLLLGINIADIPGLSSVHSFLPLQSQSAEGAPEELVQSNPPSAEMLPQVSAQERKIILIFNLGMQISFTFTINYKVTVLT